MFGLCRGHPVPVSGRKQTAQLFFVLSCHSETGFGLVLTAGADQSPFPFFVILERPAIKSQAEKEKKVKEKM